MTTLYAAWLDGDHAQIAEYMAALRAMPGVGQTAVYQPDPKPGKFLRDADTATAKLDVPGLVATPATAWALAELDCVPAGLRITELLGPRPYRHVQYPGRWQADGRIAEGPARIVVTQELMSEVNYVPGRADTDDRAFGQAVQFGAFSAKTTADEWKILEWYERLRFEELRTVEGHVRTRRYATIAGFGKFGILYEFTSLAARQTGFEDALMSKSARPDAPIRILDITVHAPGAPYVGEQIAV